MSRYEANLSLSVVSFISNSMVQMRSTKSPKLELLSERTSSMEIVELFYIMFYMSLFIFLLFFLLNIVLSVYLLLDIALSVYLLLEFVLSVLLLLDIVFSVYLLIRDIVLSVYLLIRDIVLSVYLLIRDYDYPLVSSSIFYLYKSGSVRGLRESIKKVYGIILRD